MESNILKKEEIPLKNPYEKNEDKMALFGIDLKLCYIRMLSLQ